MFNTANLLIAFIVLLLLLIVIQLRQINKGPK